METILNFALIFIGLITALCFTTLLLLIKNNRLSKELEAEKQKAKMLLHALNNDQNYHRSLKKRLKEVLDLHPELRTEKEKLLETMNNSFLRFIGKEL